MFLSLFAWLWPVVPSWIAAQVFSPFLKTETQIRSYLPSGYDDQPSKTNLAEEIEYLKAENAELRSLLSDNEEEPIVASVIGRPNTLPYDILIIDKGSDDGIEVNTPVYLAEHQAIGIIARVYNDQAMVALVSTPNWSSTVYIYGPNIYTTITGIGGGVARVHVPQGIELNTGDVVALPSLGAGIYGTIAYVDSIPSRPEQYGYVTMDIPLNSLHFVTVGREALRPKDFASAKEVVERLRTDLLSVPVPEGVLVDIDTSSSTATSTATSTSDIEISE